MEKFFRKESEPNLGAFRRELERLLDVYYEFTERRIGFGDFSNFVFTPEKGYTARTIVPVIADGERISDLYVLLFKPGDGTGDESTFKLGDMNTKNVKKLESDDPLGKEVVPRKKYCPTEVFFPFGSASSERMNDGVVSLEVLTLNGNNYVEKEFVLGLDCQPFLRSLREKPIDPYIQFTTGYRPADKVRFGDPHAVYFPKVIWGVVQMVGFLELDVETELYKFLRELASKGPAPKTFITPTK